MTYYLSGELVACHCCGKLTDLALLDAKPSHLDMARYHTLADAADAGCNFTRLECEECYGPEWNPMSM
ncbi:hypothetical protein [Methylocystis sp. ATCC 49242]|uniref:hypothetical protein n=1 Tax=Methylocystis sp. ATCC 49242 TaxID=622637 RepID=UPI0001F87100|nr:hypothetical protein [Methylocystis sp. ATCC 49242]